jgi:hypothetical protein
MEPGRRGRESIGQPSRRPAPNRSFRESLCVVSHDVNTMTSAAAATIAAGQQFPGLFLVRQTTPVRAAIETILLAWSASEHDEWRNQVVFLPF